MKQDGTKIYINIKEESDNYYCITFLEGNIPYVDDIVLITVKDINIMCVKIGNKYKLSEDCTKILQCEPSLPLYKYTTKPGDTIMKWYKTDENGNLPKNTEEYKELNKAIFTITSNGELTLSESKSWKDFFGRPPFFIPPNWRFDLSESRGLENLFGKPTFLAISNFGKLVNNGKLILNGKTSILAPTIMLGGKSAFGPTRLHEDESALGPVIEFGEYKRDLRAIQQRQRSAIDQTIIPTMVAQLNKSIILNLNDVAIDNSNGTIVLKAGSTIDSIVEAKSIPGERDREPMLPPVSSSASQQMIRFLYGKDQPIVEDKEGAEEDIKEQQPPVVQGKTREKSEKKAEAPEPEKATGRPEAEEKKLTIEKGIGGLSYGSLMPIIQGGTVDISDLIDWSNNEIKPKMYAPHLNIKSAFYNVNIKLLPEKQNNISALINYFNDDANFTSSPRLYFKNMMFFSDIRGRVTTTTRHSAVLIPGGLSILENNEKNKDKYNNEKPVISKAYFNKDNVLKLFYPENVIKDKSFKENPPLVVDYTEVNVSLYELLNNPAHYINDINVKANTKKLSDNYSLDLSPFVKNDGNVVDYSKFDENGNINLEKIQFVSDKDSKDNLDLTLNPSYVMDGNTKVENTTIDMKSTYDGWKGVITPTSNKIKLSTGTYIIKASKYLSIETEGDVNLYFDNKDKLNLCELSNSNGTLSVFQYNYKENSPLTIKLASDDCIIFPNKATNINAPVSIQFVKDNVMSTKKVYIEIKDLINDYIKAKVAGVTEDINAKYATISDRNSGVESKLKKINKFLTEIEDSTSKTDYAEYFHKIGEYGITPGCNDVKKYSEIKNVQDKLIKINKLKMEVLEGYLEVLNHYMSTLSDGDGAKTIVQRKIDETKQNISTTKENQIKMLKNKYYIINKYHNMFARNANITTSLAKEITNLSGETFPSVEVDTVSCSEE